MLDPESDFISDFFAHTGATADVRSPEIFRKWVALGLLAAACERRIWVKTGIYKTYMNLYTFIVARSGTGKQIISTARALLKEALREGSEEKAFRVSPSNMTSASLVDSLEESLQSRIGPDGKPFNYSSLAIVSEELAALMSVYDKAYIGILNDVYNNPDTPYEEGRRGHKITKIIEFPGLNILAGIQPAYMATLFPEEVWSTGMMRRFVMVYSSEMRVIDPFGEFPPQEESRFRIEKKLSKISSLIGEIDWTPEAANEFRIWLMGGQAPVPGHSKLESYNASRAEKVIRLAGLSALSRSLSTKVPIGTLDLSRAFNWLFEVEKQMPEIFRAMVGRSDSALVEELWRAMAVECMRTKAPVDMGWCWRFIGERTTHDKIEGIMKMAQKTNYIEQADLIGELWRPKGKHLHILE